MGARARHCLHLHPGDHMTIDTAEAIRVFQEQTVEACIARKHPHPPDPLIDFASDPWPGDEVSAHEAWPQVETRHALDNALALHTCICVELNDLSERVDALVRTSNQLPIECRSRSSESKP